MNEKPPSAVLVQKVPLQSSQPKGCWTRNFEPIRGLHWAKKVPEGLPQQLPHQLPELLHIVTERTVHAWLPFKLWSTIKSTLR